MTTGTATVADWRTLESTLAGQLILPTSEDYDAARTTANARFDDVRPAAIVRCATPADVQASLAAARRTGLGVVARGGGHSMDGRSSTLGIVIDLSPMSGVRVAANRVTIGAGTRLGEVYDSLAGSDLMIPVGSCPSVGVAGLTLGGGLGFVGRRYGLTCDHLLAATVVLADGRIVEADRDHHEDLFWALRGGGMLALGIVTELVFEPRAAEATTNFRLTWSVDRAIEVIEAWQAWAPDAPDEMSASLTLIATAGLDAPVVEVFGAMLGTEAESADLLDRLVGAVGEPSTAFVQAMPHRAAVAHWAALGDRFRLREAAGPRQRPYRLTKSEFFRDPIPADSLGALVNHFRTGATLSEEREVSFIPWGGAYNRPAPNETAFPFRQERFMVQHAITVDPGSIARVAFDADAWVTRSWELIHPWATGGVFPNFGDPALIDPAAAYYGPNFARLTQVKARYDPDGALGASVAP